MHSESEVQESAGNGYYEATVTGKYGKVVLYLGSSASKAAPQGYTRAVKGNKYAVYYTGNGDPKQALEEVGADHSFRGEKILRDGRLMIRHGEKLYDLTGRQVR